MPIVEEMSLAPSSSRPSSRKVEDNSLKVLTTDEIKNRRPSAKKSSNFSHGHSKISDFKNGKITEESFKSDSSMWNEEQSVKHPILVEKLLDS